MLVFAVLRTDSEAYSPPAAVLQLYEVGMADGLEGVAWHVFVRQHGVERAWLIRAVGVLAALDYFAVFVACAALGRHDIVVVTDFVEVGTFGRRAAKSCGHFAARLYHLACFHIECAEQEASGIVGAEIVCFAVVEIERGIHPPFVEPHGVGPRPGRICGCDIRYASGAFSAVVRTDNVEFTVVVAQRGRILSARSTGSFERVALGRGQGVAYDFPVYEVFAVVYRQSGIVFKG